MAMSFYRFSVLILMTTLAASCATLSGDRGPASTSLTPAEKAALMKDFDANFVDRVREKLRSIPPGDTVFVELLKRNAIRGLECNREFNDILQKEHGAYLPLARLDSLELSRMTTCGDMAIQTMRKETPENQVLLQRAFFEQLVTEVDTVVKYGEPKRSPAGLKIEKLIEFNKDTQAIFEERCKDGSRTHCSGLETIRPLYHDFEKVVRTGLRKNPRLRENWVPPLLTQFFRDLRE